MWIPKFFTSSVMAIAKPHPTGKKSPSSEKTTELQLKQRVVACLNKLSDRDTHAIAASELESIAQNLPIDFFSVFISIISATDSSFPPYVRRQCIRLLGLLSQFHGDALSPWLPKLVAAVIRRLRDPDSAVRSTCADSIKTMASSITKPQFSNAFLKPLSDSLFLEQDLNGQNGSAMCLSAAIEAAVDLNPEQLQRLMPRLLKLLKKDAFKAKPALLNLIGSFIGVGGASNSNLLGLLIHSMEEYLRSDDWAVRKAAADAFARLAIAERDLLSDFRASCIDTFETRRCDKVKVVRETMNRMLEAWKEIPCDTSNSLQSESSFKENSSHGKKSSDSPHSDSLKSKKGINASSTITRKVPPTIEKKSCLDGKKIIGWKLDEHYSPSDEERSGCTEKKKEETHSDFVIQGGKVLFVTNQNDSMNAFSESKSTARVVPIEEGIPENGLQDIKNYHANGELEVIQKQLLQIQNQQSSMLELVEKFMGNSQTGIRSLETRVHSLEILVNELSHEFNSPELKRAPCCLFPGAEFLSSKLRKKSQESYSTSRFSTSTSSSMPSVHGNLRFGNRRFGQSGGFMVNPLAAESYNQPRTPEIIESKFQNNVIHG